MNRRLWRLLALLALIVASAACGSDDDGDDEASPPAGGDGGGELAGERIEVAAVWSGDEQESFGAVLSAFEEETGAEVSFRSTGDDIATVLGTRLEGGSPPDVAMLPQPGLLRDLVARDALQPVDDIVGDLVDEHYSEDWRALATVDDTLYGVFFKAANKSTVWYRPEAFEDAGIETPETWEDFIAAAETLRDSGVTPLAVGGGDGWTLTDWFENVFLRVAGGETYDQLTAHEIPWTDESVVTSLQHLADLWSQRDLLAGNPASMTFPQSVTTVFGGDAAIVYEGDFVAGVITEETEAVPGEDALFFPFPSVDGSDPAVVGGGDVAVLMSDNPAAEELIRFLATPEAAEIWAELGGFTSPNQGVDLDAYPDDIARQSAEELVSAETFRFDLSDLVPSAFGGTPSQGMWKILQDFLADPSNPEQAAQALEAAAAAAYE